jgi:hypothetical protein
MANKMSRWLGPKRRATATEGSVPRYTKDQEARILRLYGEGKGWSKGARLNKGTMG